MPIAEAGKSMTSAQNQEGFGTENEKDSAPEGAHESRENDLQNELEKSRDEARMFQDKYLRQAADLENYRRRTEREKSELLKFAAENLVKDLIPVLDSFNQAAGASRGVSPEGTQDSTSVVQGMEMVRQQLLAALRKHGLEEVPAVGSSFDPNVHQAIQRIEDAACESEAVAQEFAKGYLLNGRLVRPAIVSVTVPGK